MHYILQIKSKLSIPIIIMCEVLLLSKQRAVFATVGILIIIKEKSVLYNKLYCISCFDINYSCEETYNYKRTNKTSEGTKSQ